MGKCYGRIWVVVMFIFFYSATAEPLRCKFPEDFSHKAKSTDLWIQSREKRQVLDNWDKKQWATIHKRLNSRANSSAWESYESEANVDEFMKWTLENTRSPTSSRRFTVRYMERPWWRADGSQVLSSFAAGALKQGDTILDLPVRLSLSDVWEDGDPQSLYTNGAPWEVRLASKLLRERSKGWQSRWESYIKLLPRFIPSPMFFSELEINNIQDKSTQDEVEQMQKFAKSTFQHLHVDEIAGAKFGDYVWALSVVYNSACQVNGRTEGNSASVASHYIVPFFRANPDETAGVYAEYEDGSLKLSAYDVNRGTPLAAEYASTNLRDTFLFQGFVPKIAPQHKVTVFDDVLDLVDWYSSAHGGVNNNRYLTFELAQDATSTIAAALQESATTSNDELAYPGGDFSVGADGYVDMTMITILATLCYANHAISGTNETETFTTIDFVVKTGKTEWEEVLRGIALESLSQYGLNASHCNASEASRFQPAFSSANLLIQERLATFLDSFSTSIVEDTALLAAAEWEGMNELEVDQLGCPSCRWQIEQMSYHDNLAVQFRASLKKAIVSIISGLACGASFENNIPNVKDLNSGAAESLESLQEFLTWCEGHDLIISEKLAITEIAVPTNDQGSRSGKYRGVVALEDVHQGQTLCTLPMSVGLFNNDSGKIDEVDSWDLAAARLLREKAKGKESTYAPYIAILPDYLPTPIHLDSQEVMEVQWLPMVRELVQVRKAIKESFGRLSQDQLASASFQQYEWAVTMVHSRAFTLPVRGYDMYEQYVLMPFMDMINHHYGYQADWMSQDVWDDKLEIVARRPIRKGEELFASFGPRRNDNFFLYYGFLLQDNPFDSAPIFGSFEEALKWFLHLWTNNCKESSGNSVEEARCQRRDWQLLWSRMKDRMEKIERGDAAAGRDWAELLGYWADLGYQFLPYQPGPTIYPNGVIDPSLLAAFSTFYDVICSGIYESPDSFPRPDLCSNCGNRTALGSSAMKVFFQCIEFQGTLPHGLFDGQVCQPQLAHVLQLEQELERGTLLARISVALRCSEILASFPTTIDHDRRLLDSATTADDCGGENSPSCRTSQHPSRHLQLTWQYRYMKKLLLRAPIDNVLP